MSDLLFHGKTHIQVAALCIGERIDTRPLDASRRLATAPLVIDAGNQGCAAVFRYGCVVMFGLDAAEEVAFLGNIRPLVYDPFDVPFQERAELFIDASAEERPGPEGITLRQVDLFRLQIVADILSKSVVLDRYEKSLGEGFERIEPLAVSLKRHGSAHRGARRLLRQIGEALLIEHKMVHRVEVGEKPELLWEHGDLESLYSHLEREYELGSRRRALERKLDLVSRTIETVLDLLNHKRSLRVEWYIVILIVVEILLTLYEMFIGKS